MEVELVKTTLHAVLSPSQLQKSCVRKKELTPLQISLKTGSTAAQLVDEWGGTIAQLNMGAPLYDVAANGETFRILVPEPGRALHFLYPP